jgi:hypothetical protein
MDVLQDQLLGSLNPADRFPQSRTTDHAPEAIESSVHDPKTVLVHPGACWLRCKVSAEALRLVRVVFRSQASLVPGNLFLRKQLTLLIVVMVQESPTWPRELRPNRTHKRPERGHQSNYPVSGLTGKRVPYVSVNQAARSSKDSEAFASSSKSAAYGKSTQSNAGGFVPRHPGCTMRSLVKQHLGEGAPYA